MFVATSGLLFWEPAKLLNTGLQSPTVTYTHPKMAVGFSFSFPVIMYLVGIRGHFCNPIVI